jgi:hypothetical protein
LAPRILAYRPATVTSRLGPRSAACPLSLRDLLRAAARERVVLPVIRAPVAGIARGALVAAREAHAAVGLALPTGVAPEPWFAAVTRAADELAGALPIFLSAELAVEGPSEPQVERAFNQAWRLVTAGITHLAVDAEAVPAAERARAVEEVARVAAERGICVDLVFPLEDAGTPARIAAACELLSERGIAPDLVSVRCAAPAGRDEARQQVRRLVEVCAALRGLPVMRRGEITGDLVAALAGSPVKACEDGGAAERAATATIPFDLLPPASDRPSRTTALETAVAELSGEGAERLEVRAYVEVADLVDRLGAAGSALPIARALERELEAG